MCSDQSATAMLAKKLTYRVLLIIRFLKTARYPLPVFFPQSPVPAVTTASCAYQYAGTL